jgi:hypothetical protein
MTKTKWFTLGAAATLFASAPALAAEGHQHGASGSHAGKHDAAADQGKAAPAPSYGKKAKGRTVEVTVTKDGFVPAQISAKGGEVLNLVVTRKVKKTCATELVQKEQGVYAPLPLDKPVAVTLVAPKNGQLEFSCAHGHIAGNVVTQ